MGATGGQRETASSKTEAINLDSPAVRVESPCGHRVVAFADTDLLRRETVQQISVD